MPTYIYRSAKTGRIVTEKWALKHPATTVKELNPYRGVKVKDPVSKNTIKNGRVVKK